MANENGSKVPTWQWVAISAISILLALAAILLNETRADIREVRQSTVSIGLRVVALETTMPLQFETTRVWREEIKTSLEKIMTEQQKTNARLDKSAVTLKEWRQIK